MKNLFTAILIAVISTSVFAAEYYVYDYKASIKRLDYILTTKKVSKVDTVIQKYKVASDTIKGYVVIPACIYCTTAQDGAASSIGMESEGWFVRVGDKLSAKYGIPYVAHDAEVYVAGAKLSDGKLLSSGGRVLGVSCTGESLREAVDRAYRAAAQIHFENAYCRRDIGARALAYRG